MGDAGAGGDTITSDAGENVIIAGLGADHVLLGGGVNIVLGDNGSVALNNASANDIATDDITLGGDDTIEAGAGTNKILGGFGADTITLGGVDNVVLGDNGVVLRNGGGVVTLV